MAQIAILTMAVQRPRRQTGAVIIEGAVGMSMIIAAVVAGTLLLVNCGVATYYKAKLGFAAQEIATFGANVPTGSNPTAPTRAFANQFLRIAALNDAEVIVNRVTIGGEEAVKVEVRAKALKLIGNGNFLPKSLTLSETAVALRHNWKPDYLLTLSLRENYGNTMVTVPCYGRQFDPGFSGHGIQHLPRGTAGRFWMNFPNGGFTASVNGYPSEHIFGNGSPSNHQ